MCVHTCVLEATSCPAHAKTELVSLAGQCFVHCPERTLRALSHRTRRSTAWGDKRQPAAQTNAQVAMATLQSVKAGAFKEAGGTGLGDGDTTNAADVSAQIENEDQLLGAQQQRPAERASRR